MKARLNNKKEITPPPVLSAEEMMASGSVNRQRMRRGDATL